MGSSKGNERVRKIVDLQDHPDPYVTTSDLADYWLVSRKQIYKQIEAGTLRAIRLGPRLLRISTAEAIRFEENAKMSPPSDHQTPPRSVSGGPTGGDAVAADTSQSPLSRERRKANRG
jgi:excisionase family DNA binding protein